MPPPGSYQSEWFARDAQWTALPGGVMPPPYFLLLKLYNFGCVVLLVLGMFTDDREMFLCRIQKSLTKRCLCV